MRYVFDFGSANAGGAPTFDFFIRLDTLAALTQPTIIEIGVGEYYFDYDWNTAPAGVTSIAFKAVLNGVELSDVISGGPPGAVTTASPGIGTLNGYMQAGTILNRAAVQCGLAARTDPFDGQDDNFVQLVEFLNSLGDELNNKHDWTQFVKECTITTAGNANVYDLPSDFHEMMDQTGWNRSTRLPLIGPLSGQETQFLKARLSGVLINVAFRIEGNTIVFPITPANGATLVFEYISDAWVAVPPSVTASAKEVTAFTDVVLYDPLMMIRGTRLGWLQAKGFDTTVAQRDFDGQLEHAIGRNVGGRTLNLDGGGLGKDRLVDELNIPITNYGH